MVGQEEISVVINTQKQSFLGKEVGLLRSALPHIPIIPSYVTIISGLRRCGKSTLLLQLLRDRYQDALYLNFEDIRLVNFETADFTRLYQELRTRRVTVVFLDEVQLIDKWEIFVHQLLREDYQVFVTVSNASLLSKELGTHLTGRHVSMELFPFSYREFVEFTTGDYGEHSLRECLQYGGIPEYVKVRNSLIVNTLMADVLVKDIAVRHSVRDVESLKQLAVYLVANVGSPVSANKLTGLFGVRSTATLLEFFSYFRDAYLIEFLPQFSYSLKAQSRNPKKVYAIDTGLITAVSTAFTENNGRRLENLIYLHLRRQFSELYYFNEEGECDFVVFQQNKAIHAVQVCYQIDDVNFDREYRGLLAAMKAFNLQHGTIVTFNQADRFEEDGRVIELVPAFVYLQHSK